MERSPLCCHFGIGIRGAVCAGTLCPNRMENIALKADKYFGAKPSVCSKVDISK
jgi:hypothetical protein